MSVENVRKNALILQAWVTGGSAFDSLLQDIVHTVSGQRRTTDIWKSHSRGTVVQFTEPCL